MTENQTFYSVVKISQKMLLKNETIIFIVDCSKNPVYI